MSILFGMLVGLALGLTGGGGSIFAVPLLVYGLGVVPRNAVAISLIAVAATAAYGAVEGWWRSVLEWRAALIFAVAGMLAAPAGVWIGGHVSGRVTVLGFALLMLAVAARMLMRARRAPQEARVIRARVAPEAVDDSRVVCRYSRDGRLHLTARCSAALLAAGLIVGVLSGLFGVGGGFLIVPTLVLITDMGIHRAVATSLLVIALIGASGVASALLAGRVLDPELTLLFIGGGLLGMTGGRLLARRMAGRKLQTIFALAMIFIAGFMLVRNGAVS